MMIDKRKYTRKSQHFYKTKARQIAQNIRNVGARARVIKEIHPEGTLWVVFRNG